MKGFLRWIYHKTVPENITKYIWNTRARRHYFKTMIEEATRRLERRDLLRFDIHVAEHCNLNCKGCEHFSTLAPKKYLDVKIFERDCRRLSELTGGWIDDIAVLGGEPLLHPQITSILSIARNYFPTGKILILTNGTLLSTQNSSFWESCNKNHINIEVSSYPLNLDDDMIKQKARTYSVPLKFSDGGGGKSKGWQKVPLDLRGAQDIQKNFKICDMAGHCYQLVDGKLYQCAKSAYAKYFNEYFKQNLVITDDDYIDIYKAGSINEILDWFCKPPQFCRYCNINKKIMSMDWGVSKKDINEWV
jgi:hypothetical protein